jgi:hypothetical protein
VLQVAYQPPRVGTGAAEHRREAVQSVTEHGVTRCVDVAKRMFVAPHVCIGTVRDALPALAGVRLSKFV